MLGLPVSYGQEAIVDLQNVRNYILYISKSAAVAERYMRRLLTFCDKVGWFPNAGYPLRRGNQRRRVFEASWIIVYRIHPDRVEILRVVSGRRDLKRYRR